MINMAKILTQTEELCVRFLHRHSLIKCFPNISADFRIVLSLPVSVVTGEELFSAEADNVTQTC